MSERIEEKVDAIITLMANQKNDIEKEINQMIALKINQRDNLDEKLKKVMYLSEKVDLVLEKLEAQERRAKWGIIWKAILFFFIFVLPLYFSYQLISGIDFGAISEGLENVKNLQSTTPNIDFSKVLENLRK